MAISHRNRRWMFDNVAVGSAMGRELHIATASFIATTAYANGENIVESGNDTPTLDNIQVGVNPPVSEKVANQ